MRCFTRSESVELGCLWYFPANLPAQQLRTVEGRSLSGMY